MIYEDKKIAGVTIHEKVLARDSKIEQLETKERLKRAMVHKEGCFSDEDATEIIEEENLESKLTKFERCIKIPNLTTKIKRDGVVVMTKCIKGSIKFPDSYRKTRVHHVYVPPTYEKRYQSGSTWYDKRIFLVAFNGKEIISGSAIVDNGGNHSCTEEKLKRWEQDKVIYDLGINCVKVKSKGAILRGSKDNFVFNFNEQSD